jgi:sporulation protein YlmC with PRC-barrel domain
MESELVRYVVLSFNSDFADVEDRLLVVPLVVLQFDPADQTLVFNVDAGLVEEAPAFEPDAWPDIYEPAWEAIYEDYWEEADIEVATPLTSSELPGRPPVPAPSEPPVDLNEVILRASDLLSYPIASFQGEELGRIEDLVIGLASGRVKYAALGFNDKLFAIRLNAFEPDIAQEELVLNATQEQLASLPGFEPNDWPELANPHWNAPEAQDLEGSAAGEIDVRA